MNFPQLKAKFIKISTQNQKDKYMGVNLQSVNTNPINTVLTRSR